MLTILKAFSHASASLVILEAIVRQTSMIVQVDLVNMEQLAMMGLQIIPAHAEMGSKDETVTLISMSVQIVLVYGAHV